MTDTFDKPTIAGLVTDAPYVSTPLTENQELVLKLAWLKFDDLYDSIEGGPHLKDRSKTDFDAEKTSMLLAYSIARINYGNPPLAFTMDDFPYDTDNVLLAQSLVLDIIQHLIRSYVEQPTPTGTGYSRLARQDYVTKWQSVLQIEQKAFDDMVRIFRRRYLNLGHTAGLIQHRYAMGMGNIRGRLKARGRWYGG